MANDSLLSLCISLGFPLAIQYSHLFPNAKVLRTCSNSSGLRFVFVKKTFSRLAQCLKISGLCPRSFSEVFQMEFVHFLRKRFAAYSFSFYLIFKLFLSKHHHYHACNYYQHCGNSHCCNPLSCKYNS